MRRVLIMVAGLVALPALASAQGVYVSAGIGAEVGRTMSGDGFTDAGTGEALAWSLRVGSHVTPTFGVELDFTRPSEIEREDSPDFRILAARQGSVSYVFNGVPGPVLDLSFPAPSIQVRSEQRNTTVTAAAFARQEVSPRLSLVYLGGVAFARVEREYTYEYGGPFPRLAIFPPASSSESIDYSVGPMVGFESRINLAEHAQLIPGVRLLGVAGGWSVRPAVSLGWSF